jgi:digeranylgeranylglycerophospholipid reductase
MQDGIEEEMEHFDVIVVGAGPAGSTAAKAAAERGAKTILLEEHPDVGIPEHCMGIVAAPADTPLMQMVYAMDDRVLYRRLKGRRIYTPKGKVVDKEFVGVDVVALERQIFDVNLADQAAAAGVEVVVNTAVTGLINEGDAVVGVKTSNRAMPEIYGKIVIAADGIRALLKGVPNWEKMTRPDQQVSSGIKWYLGNTKDVSEDCIEVHLGEFSERGFVTVVPIGNNCVLADMVSTKELERIRNGNWAISAKLRDCAVLRMTGFSHPYPMGVMLAKRVKNGLMLVGDSGGFLGVDAAVATGMVAGSCAATAVAAGDVSEQGLAEYTRISQEIGEYKFGYAVTFHNLDHFMGKSDDEIEHIFDSGIEL